MHARLILTPLLGLVMTNAIAGEFNRTLDVGDKSPVWKDLPGTDDKSHSLADLSNDKAVVVVFTCNSCPYAVDAEDRLNKLTTDYADQGVSVVAINVNLIEEDSMPAMKQRAAAEQLAYAYLFDESQQIAKDFGAKRTPECFVLDGDRKVVYMGALDDSPDGKSITQTYVRDALDAVLAGQTVEVAETNPIGCLIRIKRSRRGR